MARVSFTVGGVRTTVALGSNLLVVGSDPTCNVVFTGADVSPIHAELRKGPDGWRIVDLESRAGTRVNGEFVNQRVLRDGDVIDIGGVPLRFEGDTAANQPLGPPLVSPKAPRASAGVPRATVAHGAAPVTRARREADERAAGDDEETPSRRDRRMARQANSASTWMFVVAGVLGLALVGWMVFKFAFSSTPNHDRRALMGVAEREMQWQKVIDLGAGAVDDGGYDYQQIQESIARAKKAVAGEATGVRVDQSIKDWNEIRVWRQNDHWKDDAEYLQMIDGYLAKYGDLESEGTRQARQDRVKIAGTSASGPQTGDAAWLTALADAKALEADGRFGAALEKMDAYWTAHQATAPTRITNVEAEKERLTKAAERWFSVQVLNAQHFYDNGEKRKCQRILENAAQKIGLPGYADRASEALTKITSGGK